MRNYEMIFSGSGGQGLMFIGKMLAKLAIDEYPYVTFLPTYGAEVRSGTSYCNVKLSDDPIATPVVDFPDVMVLMNQPSVDRFLPRLRVGKIAFVNSSMASGNACTGVVEIPANQIALELGDVQAANVVMIGAMLGRERLLDHGKALEAVRASSARKGEKAVELNQKAFEKGWELGTASRQPLQKTARTADNRSNEHGAAPAQDHGTQLASDAPNPGKTTTSKRHTPLKQELS